MGEMPKYSLQELELSRTKTNSCNLRQNNCDKKMLVNARSSFLVLQMPELLYVY